MAVGAFVVCDISSSTSDESNWVDYLDASLLVASWEAQAQDNRLVAGSIFSARNSLSVVVGARYCFFGYDFAVTSK